MEQNDMLVGSMPVNSRLQQAGARPFDAPSLTPAFPHSTLKMMEVHFIPDPDQEAFIRQGIANGRYRTAEDAVRDAMARWEEGERIRLELLTTLDEAEADLETGRYADYSDGTLPMLAAELKREARTLRNPERNG